MQIGLKNLDACPINITGYNTVRSDRNRHGGGVLCYIKNTICYNRRESFSTEIENIFVDIVCLFEENISHKIGKYV